MIPKDGQPIFVATQNEPAATTAPLPTAEAMQQFVTLKESIGDSLRFHQDGLKRREFEELSRGVGTWKIKALNQLVYKIQLPPETLYITKLLQGACVVYIFVLSLMHMFRPTACINAATVSLKIEEKYIAFLYSFPAFVHLVTVAWILSSFAYYKVCVFEGLKQKNS